MNASTHSDEYMVLRSQIATLKPGRGQHRKYAPFAFTEHGAIMAATILASPRAVQVSLYVVRAFVRLREAAAQHKDLAQQLAELQDKTVSLAMQHDTFSRNTRNQLKQVFETLRELTASPDIVKRPMGFVYPKEGAKTKAIKAGNEANIAAPVKALARMKK
jgi:phage regulator Rha-like protein